MVKRALSSGKSGPAFEFDPERMISNAIAEAEGVILDAARRRGARIADRHIGLMAKAEFEYRFGLYPKSPSRLKAWWMYDVLPRTQMTNRMWGDLVTIVVVLLLVDLLWNDPVGHGIGAFFDWLGWTTHMTLDRYGEMIARRFQ